MSEPSPYVPNQSWPKATPLPTSASGGLVTYDGNPNGVVTMTGPGICLGTGTTLGSVWVKTTSGTSNNEWTEVIGSEKESNET